jgi:CheY-like chemotaxis protein
MTAHVFNQDRERCFQVGMDEVIAKPVLREDLVSILKRWSAPVAA